MFRGLRANAQECVVGQESIDLATWPLSIGHRSQGNATLDVAMNAPPFERLAKNLILILTLLGYTTAPGRAATSARLSGIAPADRYFGRLKMSYLGINNTFKDAAVAAGNFTTDSGVANKVDFAMESLNDWQSQFPRDPHLSRSYFLGQITLKKIWIKKYQDKAWAYMQYIVTNYPQTFFGKTVKADIAKGFTQHYFAEPAPCGNGAESEAPAKPVDKGKYKVVVEKPPCVPAAPSPSAAPTTSP